MNILTESHYLGDNKLCWLSVYASWLLCCIDQRNNTFFSSAYLIILELVLAFFLPCSKIYLWSSFSLILFRFFNLSTVLDPYVPSFLCVSLSYIPICGTKVSYIMSKIVLKKVCIVKISVSSPKLKFLVRHCVFIFSWEVTICPE